MGSPPPVTVQNLVIPFALGLVSYVLVFKRPVRGDTWLVCELSAGCLLFLSRLWFYGCSFTASAYLAAFMIFCHTGSLAFFAALYRLSSFHPLSRFPGPILNRMTSLNLLHMVASGRRFTVIAEMHQKYGVFVRTGPNTLSINSHSAVGPIYATASAWNKSEAYSLHLPGSGLFFIQDREKHNIRRRHYWAPAFTVEMIASYTSMVQNRTKTLLEVLPDRRQGVYAAIDMSTALQHWAHDVTGELTFGSTYKMDLLRDGDERGVVHSALLEAQVFEVLGEAPSLFEVLQHLPTTKIIRIMDDTAEELLQLRRRNGSHQNDLLSHLLNENQKEIPELSDEDLRQEAVLAIQAGTNGISTALTFACFYLASNPEIHSHLKAELQGAFQGSDGHDILDTQVLAQLPYLSAVVEESLRLGAPLGSFPRTAPKGGAVVAGEHIPEGTIVGVPAWAQMLSEDNFYPEPSKFIPERWLPGGLGPRSRLNRGAIMTFSHGPFGCLGKQFAYSEMRLVISKLLLSYDLKFPPDFDISAFLLGIKNMRVTSFTKPLSLVLV